MKPFTREEIFIVTAILLFLAVVSFANFKVSLRKARDFQRKADIRSVANSLANYHEDFGFFPPADENGKIVACQGSEKGTQKGDFLTLEEKILANFVPCEWGVDPLIDTEDSSYPPYLATIPLDPKSKDGFKYIYISNTRIFQLYASLEGEDEPEYQKAIKKQKIDCGRETCNFGLASPNTPLDKSLKEYENELREEKLKTQN